MTLAKKHYQRLWFPEPGSGGDIPTRADFALTREQFDELMPVEFWREVVDRVAQRSPRHPPVSGSILDDGRLFRAHPGHAPGL
jgi:hypothetical protein